MNASSVEDRRRGSDGRVKLSSDQYRKSGERVLLLDGHTHAINLRVLQAIRRAGFKAWRTGDQLWILRVDVDAINELPIADEIRRGFSP